MHGIGCDIGFLSLYTSQSGFYTFYTISCKYINTLTIHVGLPKPIGVLAVAQRVQILPREFVRRVVQ